MQKYAEISLDQKQQILQEYQPGVRGQGFKALAKRYGIKSGHTTIRKWYQKWDGTKASLQKESGGDKRSILTEKEKKKEILGYISKRARKDAAIYREVKENIESKTGKNIALRTVRRLGKELKASSKKTKRKSPSEGKVSWLFLFHFFV
jgi:transposase